MRLGAVPHVAGRPRRRLPARSVETAWSCYCHLFRIGTQDFSFDFDSIAAYAGDYARAMAQWQAQYPQRIRTQSYEALLADPETQTRELLAFCGLEFDPACLRPHEAQRSVRTASASQVREPLRRSTAKTANYGALLDPLRAALGAGAVPDVSDRVIVRHGRSPDTPARRATARLVVAVGHRCRR